MPLDAKVESKIPFDKNLIATAFLFESISFSVKPTAIIFPLSSTITSLNLSLYWSVLLMEYFTKPLVPKPVSFVPSALNLNKKKL